MLLREDSSTPVRLPMVFSIK
eukprot:SAG11_NODE_36494_length_261_cov_0.641975_1_plen_20_part_10